MVRIAIVIPYASMASLAQEVFQEHTAQMRLQQRDSTDYSLEIIVAPTTQELLPQMPDCDAMIVRGATYLDLCRNALSVPVIELIINGTDIVNMLLQLRQKYGSVPAAVLGTQNMILGVEKLARQLNVDVTPYCFPENSVPEIRKCVEQAARDGKKVVIGGSTGLPSGRGDGPDLHADLLRAGGLLERHLRGQTAGQDQHRGAGEGPEPSDHAGQRL